MYIHNTSCQRRIKQTSFIGSTKCLLIHINKNKRQDLSFFISLFLSPSARTWKWKKTWYFSLGPLYLTEDEKDRIKNPKDYWKPSIFKTMWLYLLKRMLKQVCRPLPAPWGEWWPTCLSWNPGGLFEQKGWFVSVIHSLVIYKFPNHYVHRWFRSWAEVVPFLGKRSIKPSLVTAQIEPGCNCS